jgi:hypothetical protein
VVEAVVGRCRSVCNAHLNDLVREINDIDKIADWIWVRGEVPVEAVREKGAR